MTAHNKRTVLVGVFFDQPDAVLIEAAIFARHFDAQLVCAHVDSSRYQVEQRPDGVIVSLPFDPDLPDLREERFDPALRSQLAGVLDSSGISWSTRPLVGDAALALAHLASALDAAMIVVGTRNGSVRGTVHEFFNGSVAARLSHLQHRPVVVVPLNPVGADDRLPWAGQQ